MTCILLKKEYVTIDVKIAYIAIEDGYFYLYILKKNCIIQNIF